MWISRPRNFSRCGLPQTSSEARLPLVPTGVQFWIRTHPPRTWHSLAVPCRVPRRRSSFALTLSGRQRSTNTVSQPSVGMPSLPTRTCSFNSWRKDKASSSGIFLTVLYDDLFRRQLARRALAGEPELDVNKCFRSRDDTILETARVRLTSVLISAGLAPVPTSLSATSFTTCGPDVDIENSLLAKSHAEADAIQKKAAAAKSLEHTQAELAKANQTRAWLDQAASSQRGGGEGKGTTRTQQLGQGQPSQTNWQKVNGEWVSNKRKKQYEFAQKRTATKKGRS